MMPRAAHESPPDARAAAGWGILTPATSWGGDDATRPGELVGGAGDVVGAERPDALAAYRPPFEVTAGLLVVPALGPTAPLRRAFPGVPFLSLLGRTPLLAWFGRVTEGCAHDAAGRWRCEGGRGAVLYHELTVVAALARHALFLPATYAISARSVRLARHYYGMPKDSAAMTLRVAGRRYVAAWSVRGGRLPRHRMGAAAGVWPLAATGMAGALPGGDGGARGGPGGPVAPPGAGAGGTVHHRGAPSAAGRATPPARPLRGRPAVATPAPGGLRRAGPRGPAPAISAAPDPTPNASTSRRGPAPPYAGRPAPALGLRPPAPRGGGTRGRRRPGW
jgi:hypothetical protein